MVLSSGLNKRKAIKEKHKDANEPHYMTAFKKEGEYSALVIIPGKSFLEWASHAGISGVQAQLHDNLHEVYLFEPRKGGGTTYKIRSPNKATKSVQIHIPINSFSDGSGADADLVIVKRPGVDDKALNMICAGRLDEHSRRWLFSVPPSFEIVYRRDLERIKK
jgi:hypothetical protein